jgi:hypothetical protein
MPNVAKHWPGGLAQVTVAPEQVPVAVQRSFVVQALPSLHTVPASSGA